MNKYLILCLGTISLFVAIFLNRKSDEKIKEVSFNINDMYSGVPDNLILDEPLKLNSSLVEDPEAIKESLNSKPCLMTMRVSKDFLNGYRDNINRCRPKYFNATQEYVDCYNLAAKDIQEGVARRLEAIIQN
jgi:hypothetical protein